MEKVKACNWCGINFSLVDKKPYCKHCFEKCLVECLRCHKPYPDLKYISENQKYCKSCFKTIQKKSKTDQQRKKMCETVAKYFEEKMLKNRKQLTLYDAIQKSSVIRNKPARKKHVS